MKPKKEAKLEKAKRSRAQSHTLRGHGMIQHQLNQRRQGEQPMRTKIAHYDFWMSFELVNVLQMSLFIDSVGWLFTHIKPS